MSQVPADEQMRSRLQGLKASGAFSRDAQGRLPELDPGIAAELIDGEKPGLFQVGQASPLSGVHALDIPRTQAPLPAMRDGAGAPGNSSSEPVPRKGSGRISVQKDQARHTEDLMRQISTELEQFNRNLVVSFETAKVNMGRDLVDLFDTTSREKLPDCFLKSLPKFGGGVTKLHQHFFRQSANRKKEHTQMDRRDVPIDLVVQPEVRQEISDDIHAVIDRELVTCCGEEGAVVQDLKMILRQVTDLMGLTRQCERDRQSLLVQKDVLEEQLGDRATHTDGLQSNIDTLIEELREKKTEQQRLTSKALREEKMKKDSHQDYLRQIRDFKTELMRLQVQREELDPYREQKLSPRSREAAKEGRRESSSGMYASAEMNFDLAMGVDSGDTAAAVEEAEKRVRGEMEDRHRQQAKDERERHMKEENKLRIKLEEQIEECKRLEKEHLKIETELVEVKQTLRLGKREPEGN